MSRIIGTVEGEPELSPQVRAILDAHGIDYSLQARGTKEFAKRIAPLLPTIGGMPQGHGKALYSNGIVVVDNDGNIVAITHTIHSVIWSHNGIVVGGVPQPDTSDLTCGTAASTHVTT